MVCFRWQPEHVAMKGMEHQLDFPDPALLSALLFLSASKSVKTIKQSINQTKSRPTSQLETHQFLSAKIVQIYQIETQ